MIINGLTKRVSEVIEAHNAINEKPSTMFRVSRNHLLYKMIGKFAEHLKMVQNLRHKGLLSDSDTIPPMKWNKPAMTKYFGGNISEKSMYNYLRFYQDAGILIKVNHGWQNDFDLYFHPTFFNPQVVFKPTNLLSQTTSDPSFNLSLSNFLPPIYTQETQEILTYYNKAVENVDNLDYQVTTSSNPHFRTSNDTRESHKKGVNNEKFDNNTRIGAGGGQKNIKDKGQTMLSEENQGLINPDLLAKNAKEALAMRLVAQFWAFAKQNCYANYTFSQKQEQKIMTLILNDVFSNYQGVYQDEAKMKTRYQTYLNALQKSINYAEKNAWISFLPPLHFFSKSFFELQKSKNQKGSFFFAVEWHKKDTAQLTHTKKQLIVETAKRCISRTIAPKGRKDLQGDKMQITLYHVQKVQKLGQRYVDDLNKFISNPYNLHT